MIPCFEYCDITYTKQEGPAKLDGDSSTMSSFSRKTKRLFHLLHNNRQRKLRRVHYSWFESRPPISCCTQARGNSQLQFTELQPVQRHVSDSPTSTKSSAKHCTLIQYFGADTNNTQSLEHTCPFHYFGTHCIDIDPYTLLDYDSTRSTFSDIRTSYICTKPAPAHSSMLTDTDVRVASQIPIVYFGGVWDFLPGPRPLD